MKKPSKSKPKNEWHFVDRLYRWLPIFLLLMSFANVYFTIKYVNSERVDFEVIRDRALLNVSNSYVFVERSISNEINYVRAALSNEILRVKFSNDMRLRPVHSSSTAEKKDDLPLLPERAPSDKRVISARYFRFSRRPYLDFGGFYYTMGDDFGYGVIDYISPVGVVCNGTFYSLENKKEIVSNGLP